jgi:DNA-binding protein HU-beta
MNKQEFTEDFARRCEFSKAEAGRVVDAILDSLTELLTARDEVGFTGFGKFSTRIRDSREARDPRDPSRTIRVPAAVVPKFTAGSTLREVVRAAAAPGANADKPTEAREGDSQPAADSREGAGTTGQSGAKRDQWVPLGERGSARESSR